MVVLCNSWSSVSLPILSVSCWQWWPMTSTRLSSSPLLYAVSMSSRVCSLLMLGVFLVGITVSQIHTPLAYHLCFCGSNVIDHFFLWFTSIFFFPLSCSDIQINELMIVTALGFIELSTISGVLALIFISSFQSWRSTLLRGESCTFHLTAVSIFQETLLFMYFRPSSSFSLDEDKMTSLFYTLVIPLLNPLIFSLWNKDVKEALIKLKAKLQFKVFVLCICAHNHTHIVIVSLKFHSMTHEKQFSQFPKWIIICIKLHY